MQNSQVFLVEFGKHWVKVRNKGCFRDLRAMLRTGAQKPGFSQKTSLQTCINPKNPVYAGFDAS
ncbi:hypothetical protein QUA26_25460 [Microcoleus sp. Pol12A4]|uniref:hypothetical protein n=1 Tax=unclassified Microcoleus TaxID=2642155 RepID=UPI002FD37C80